MTGLEALAYLRNHRYGAVRCNDWAEEQFILTQCSGNEMSWWNYYLDDFLEKRFPKISEYHKPCFNDEDVSHLFECFFVDVFEKEWEIMDATKIIGNAPIECEPNDYYDPRYPEDGVISRTNPKDA